MVQYETRGYYYAYGSTPPPDQRRVVLRVHVRNLSLSADQRDKLLGMCGSRYDAATDVLQIEWDRLPIRSQNKIYLGNLLAELLAEARRPDPPEVAAERESGAP